jgi:hypothetical protein
MNTTVREVLRDVIAQQSDAVPPVGLVERVISRYRRRRTIRAASAGVAVVMAAAVAVPVVLDARGTREPTAGAWTGNKVVITSLSGASRPRSPSDPPVDPKVGITWVALLLNPRTGKYDELPQDYMGVVPSPDGRWAVIGASTIRRSRIGVLDRANGQVRWLDIEADMNSRIASWAPDSTRFVLTRSHQAVVVDAATLATTPVAPVPSMFLPMGGSFVWSPGGDRLLGTEGGTVSYAAPFVHLNEYDLTGRHQRTLPVHVRVDSSAQFSPDHDRIALLDYGDPTSRPPAPQARIVDAATGAEEPLAVPLPASTYELVAWYDAEHLVVAVRDAGDNGPVAVSPKSSAKSSPTASPTASPKAALKIVRIADGRVVHTVELPGGRDFDNIQLAPAADLPKAARKHAF